MIGNASGSSTIISVCDGVMPIPRAHSSSAGGSCFKPSTVLRTIGSNACRKSATSAGGFPTPSAIIASAMMASVGIAVTMFSICSTGSQNRRIDRRVSAIPRSTPATIAGPPE